MIDWTGGYPLNCGKVHGVHLFKLYANGDITLYDWRDVEVLAIQASTLRQKSLAIGKAKRHAEKLFNEEFADDLTERLNLLLLPNEDFIKQFLDKEVHNIEET